MTGRLRRRDKGEPKPRKQRRPNRKKAESLTLPLNDYIVVLSRTREDPPDHPPRQTEHVNLWRRVKAGTPYGAYQAVRQPPTGWDSHYTVWPLAALKPVYDAEYWNHPRPPKGAAPTEAFAVLPFSWLYLGPSLLEVRLPGRWTVSQDAYRKAVIEREVTK